MMNEASNVSSALRRALVLDAVASAAMGMLLLLGANPLERLLGIPGGLLRGAGVVLIPFAGFLVLVITRARASRGAVWTVVAANVLWALGSVLLLTSGAVRPTLLGELFVVLQAVAVLAFAYLESGGARRGARDRAAV